MLARVYVERFVTCRHRSLEFSDAGLERADHQMCVAKIILRHSPIDRHPLAGPHGERLLIGSDGPFEPGNVALARAKHLECGAEFVLCGRPLQRVALTGEYLERIPTGHDGLLQQVPVLCSAIIESTLLRFNCLPSEAARFGGSIL